MKVVGFIIALALLALGAAGALLFAIEFYELYVLAGPSVKLGIITAIGSAIALLSNNFYQSKRERQSRLFEEKRKAYDKFFEFFFAIFEGQKSGGALSDAQMQKNYSDFTRSVMTWGSASTIKAMNEYQRASLVANKSDNKKLFLITEKLLRALRKDLGHNDASLPTLALTKLVLKAEEHEKIE